MSEYQYYEFQAIDRPLSEKEMAELRSRSTRARITPTSFVNDYSWGDFKGDENAWMAKLADVNYFSPPATIKLPHRHWFVDSFLPLSFGVSWWFPVSPGRCSSAVWGARRERVGRPKGSRES